MNALDEGIAFEQKDINPETDCNSFDVAVFFVIKDSNEDLNVSNFSGGIKILNISVSIKYPRKGNKVQGPIVLFLANGTPNSRHNLSKEDINIAESPVLAEPIKNKIVQIVIN